MSNQKTSDIETGATSENGAMWKLKCAGCGTEYNAKKEDRSGRAMCYICECERWFDLLEGEAKCVRCHQRPQQYGTWCNRCEMADRAWQVEVWDKYRISNSDAIVVYGFKSRIDMEQAWVDAGLANREASYAHSII